jgi:hypothetical protein
MEFLLLMYASIYGENPSRSLISGLAPLNSSRLASSLLPR